MEIGSPHRHYARTDSTNTRARELAASGAPHGTVVTAGEQTEGRGRQGRTWSAPPGRALLYSVLVRELDPGKALLPLAVPLAVCEAAERLAPGTRCAVKWPNDVEVGGRKLAGVLVEARPQDGWGVVGVGINLAIAREEFPPELRETAVSLFEGPDPRAPDQPAATTALNERLGHWLEAEPASILAAWGERDALRGREVAWDGGSGIAEGVDDRGYLLVRVPGDGCVAVGAGEVHLTRS